MARKSQLPARPERSILSEVMAYLEIRHIAHWRMNTGTVRMKNKEGSARAERVVRFGAKGMADVLAILPGGRFWAIECKRVGKVPTADQEAFCRSVEAAGGVYTVAWGLGEVERVLESWRKPREIQMTHSDACGCGCQAKRAPALCVECGDTGAVEVDGVDRMCPACRGAKVRGEHEGRRT